MTGGLDIHDLVPSDLPHHHQQRVDPRGSGYRHLAADVLAAHRGVSLHSAVYGAGCLIAVSNKPPLERGGGGVGG